jgi:hypothetical protein
MNLKYLIIHCTATRPDQNVSAEDIFKWHTSPPPLGRGWKQVGYSDLITLSGEIVNLVPYDDDQYVDNWEITNGVKGKNNESRHIVYAGGVNELNQAADTRNNNQLFSLFLYVNLTIRKHPNILVAGHNQFSYKACPSFDVPGWLRCAGYQDKNIYEAYKDWGTN